MNRPLSYGVAVLLLVVCAAVIPFLAYMECLIEVPSKYMAVLIYKQGKDIENTDEIAPSEDFKGVQKKVLSEGRYFLNPYSWDWVIVPQIEIPEGKLGVRIRLGGDDLPPNELIAATENQKGIAPDVLNPGRYAINAWRTDTPRRTQGDSYAEIIELHDPVTIPAGFKGVVTNLSAPMPTKPNEVIVEKGKRGVQQEALEPGTYYLNPYVTQVRLMDCRSQRYNLTDIGFPTKDGFWVSLEAIIEFRVNPQQAPKVYVLYSEERNGGRVDEAIVEKIILPNARAYTRLKGSNHSGKEFITGDTRATFQEDFQKQMQKTCAEQGIEIIQALITTIKPPEKIADPVRRRQIATQQEAQYKKEIEQQGAEQELAVQKALVEQKKAEVTASQEVVSVTVEAKKKQEVALIEANQRLAVAEQKLEAAKDLASAILAKGKAEADVVHFGNLAQAAGWQKAIEAFDGNVGELARYTLLKKIAPALRAMMINSENNWLIDVFKSFEPAEEQE
jgi:regulator of protease activity HflC (stomatin/prohibitin superfamily)